jgi:glycosyltransferase involved in cell wall biosynthesis
LLPRQNKIDGHDVSIIASTEVYINNTKLGYCEPKKYVNEDGIPVRRIPYRKIPIHLIRTKVRSYQGVFKILQEEKPDVIMFHGVPAWELRTVVRYKRAHPEIKLYVDSHEDFHNSARNFFSRNVLNKIFYRLIVKSAYPHIDKILCVSLETMDFLKTMYKIPPSKLEFFPLGGIIFPEEEREQKRKGIRGNLEMTNDHILCVHSGKMDKLKRTADVINAFSKVKSDKLRLVLIGSMTDEVKKDVLPLINADPRITYLGWKTADELMEYLCAADVYVQPGGQSATMQNAICCGCAMILYPHKSHEPYLQGNGYYVKTIEDMREAFEDIVNEPEKLPIMSKNSMKIARDLLDYKKLAARLYQ